MRSLSFWKNFLLTVFVCACGNECLAQTYPVEVITILQPPYSLQLSDYASPEFEAIRISVFLRELDRHEYKVKLRLTIQSESVTLVTKENFLPPPIYLQGGMTELITGADIASYFNLNNLEVFGNVNKGELLRRGMLPEGFYTFSVEVLDYNRSVVVSNKGEASAFLILNDPPIINLPLNGDKITATDPQNIMFSWTPRNLVSPNSAFTTEYEFSLVELYPIDRNPNDAIQSSNTIYTLRTTDTGLNYGMAEPMLTPGKKYAFRVRAIDTGGKDLFKNNGYSEVFVFQYGDACLPPLNLKGKALDHQRIGVEWEEGINHTGYVINYRVHGREDWFSDEVLDWRAIIPDLSAGLELDIKVSAKCGSLASVFTDEIMVKTLATAPDFKCAKPAVYVAPPAPDPNWLQEDLKPGDTITNNVFKYVMVEVQRRPDGTYNGLATGMTMEMLNWGRPRYKVRAVRLSRKYEILEGSVATIYNLAWRPANKLGQKGEEKEKAAEESKALAVAEVKINGEIKKVSVDATTGEIVIELASGETQRQARPRNEDKDKTLKDVRITDASGDVWTVGKDGKVTEFPKGPGAEVLAEASKADFTVQFSANADQRYGFDTKTYEGGSYEKIKIKEADYLVAWKAIATGQQETVNAQAQGKSTFPTAVAFKRQQDVPTTAGASASQKQVLITGGQNDQAEKLIAYVKVQQASNEVKELEVGRLNLKTYDQIREKVVIVPVNMATVEIASVAEELNKIYGQAVALWEVSIDNSFQYDQSELDQLDQDESDIISAFPDKMKAFNKAFKNSRTIDNDAYYIFLIPGGAHRYSGYMPFKRKFGYIFTSNTTSTSLPRTIAHELAHGAFRMRHNFSEYPSITRGTTDNLMDYSTGTVLKKYQWDEVHDPHARVSWLMEDEESAAFDCGWFASGECDDVGKILDLIRDAATNGYHLKVRKEARPDKKELTAYDIELDDVAYDKIRVINLTDSTISVNPREYEPYEQEFLTREGKSEFQRGFVYRAAGVGPNARSESTIGLKVLLNHNESEFSKKLQLLERYLSGSSTKLTNKTDTGLRTFAICKKSANARQKKDPFAVIKPDIYLVLGKEVEFVSQLRDGENPRTLIRYKGEKEEYCTWSGNLKEVFSISDDQQYKLKQAASPASFAYSEDVNDEVGTDVVVRISHECGEFKRITTMDDEELGWVKASDLKKYVDNSKLGKDEFSKKFAESATLAVEKVIADWKSTEAACNLCVRATLLNLTGDDVLFPKVGSSLTIRDKGTQIYGKVVAGDGSAQGIIDDLKSDRLDDYFDEIKKDGDESYDKYWQRLQSMVDNNKAIIVGTYDPGHVFMVVPGGLYEVVDNTERANAGLNLSDTDVELGDKWGGSFATRKFDYVLRILDCGAGVKFSNGPMYGVMDAKPMIGQRSDRIVKFYKYKLK